MFTWYPSSSNDLTVIVSDSNSSSTIIKTNIDNKGKMYRDYTYIDDIVDGIYRLLNKAPSINSKNKFRNDSLSHVAPFRVLNIGNTKKIYLLNFINTLEKE